MASTTNIAWCDSVFNSWLGCTKVGPGCDNCYAEELMQNRYQRVTWGAGQPRVRTSISTWHQPVAWNAKPFFECRTCAHRFALGRKAKEGSVHCPECHGDAIKQTRRRVFCASLSDVFDNEVDPQWRADLFTLIAQCPNLDFLLLTKRIGNAAAMMFAARGDHRPLLPHLWLGATVTDQDELDRDFHKLCAVPASVHFISYEPALGPLNVGPYLSRTNMPGLNLLPGFRDPLPGLDWVIAGGESGDHARPSHPDWYRHVRNQCAAAGVPFLFKQWGEWMPALEKPAGEFSISDPARLMLWEDDDVSVKVGKQAAGRLLDGVQHNQFPVTNPTEPA